MPNTSPIADEPAAPCVRLAQVRREMRVLMRLGEDIPMMRHVA